MGKTNKSKRHKNAMSSPTGLPSVREMEAQDKEEELSVSAQSRVTSQTVINFLEKLQSADADDRDCGCAMIASLVCQKEAVTQLIQNNAVRILGPLLLDQSLAVRKNAVGALWNMSVDGMSTCELMVEQDVMTSLQALLQQYRTEWRPDRIGNNKTDVKTEVFINAVNLLWNLCEASEIALNVVAQQNLVTILLPCLQVDIYGVTVAVTVAQCLQVITEATSSDLSRLMCDINLTDCLASLQKILELPHETSGQLLLRTSVAGILHNMSELETSSCHASTISAVITVLAEVIDQDVDVPLKSVIHLISCQQASLNGGSGDGMHETAPIADEICQADSMGQGDMGEATQSDTAKKESAKENSSDKEAIALEKELEELENLLRAQQMALEITANLCCGEDEEEDWEDLDTSEGSADDMATEEAVMDEQTDTGQSNLCLPANVHGAMENCDVLSKVLAKTSSVPQSVCQCLSQNDDSKNIIKSLHNVQCRSLLCIGNMVGSMDVSALGGITNVHNMWTNLSVLAATQRAQEDMDLLEAVTSAIRAVIQKLGEAKSSKVAEMTISDLQFLFSIIESCKVDKVHANIVRIVSIVGCVLAEESSPHPLLKDIALFLLEVTRRSSQLWVIAEALDAIFDVFAEDHLNPLLQETKLLEHLRTMAPILKTQIKQQKLHLGEHLPIISTARMNLSRFISYKTSHIT